MVPQTGTAVLVLFVFVLPGFATTLLRDRLFLIRAAATDLERVLVSLAYSATIFGVTSAFVAVTGPLTGFSNKSISTLWTGQSPFAVYVGLAAWGLLIAPYLIAIADFRWHNSPRRAAILTELGVDPAHSTRSGWDHWFQQRRRCLVIVTLNDGTKTAGLFDSKSMAGYTRDGQDLFLEQRYALDDNDWFVGAVEGDYGVWLPSSQIAGLEFYRPIEDDENPTLSAPRTQREAVRALVRAARLKP